MTKELPTIFTKAEITRQRTELSRLRSKHAAEMVLSGLAGRMINAFGPANLKMNHNPLNEGTELVPVRVNMTALSHVNLTEVMHDLLVANKNADGRIFDDEAYSQRIVMVSTLPSYVLSVLRYDSVPDARPTASCRYAIGCDIAGGWRLPAHGIDPRDVDCIEAQLAAVDELRVSKELTMLNPVSLIERKSLIIQKS